MVMVSGLIAYASDLPDNGTAINLALQELHTNPDYVGLSGWPEVDIPGRFIATEVTDKIEAGSLFVADLTLLNFNVIFEIGYAIGLRKRAYIIRSVAHAEAGDRMRQVGLDTLGYKEYQNSAELAQAILGISDFSATHTLEFAPAQTSPVYVLLPEIKGDSETRVISRIKKARLNYRSFDPQEEGRLSALDCIESVARSYGVVIPLLIRGHKNASIHNARAAFTAGLARSMGKELLLLQYGDEPVPLDYRDLVSGYRTIDRIDGYVADFASAVTASLQSSAAVVATSPTTPLSQLTLGASAAENEMQELEGYYLRTDEFYSALRGEVRVVLGRKGTGKTALFVQLRNHLREDRSVVVLDLKPEGFQLRKFKEQVLDFLEEGTREHTITAFWEYLLLLEICHKLLQKDRRKHVYDHTLLRPYRELEEAYGADQYVSEGDFAERMLQLTRRIADDFDVSQFGAGTQRLRSGEITELIHKHNVPDLRRQLSAYLSHKSGLWILFDNLDKGWPPYGVGPDDVLTLRCLLDAMSKLERSFRHDNIDAHGIVFLRNDVYENLVTSTSDRGKVAEARVDWSDPEMLIELLRLRFVYSGADANLGFAELWAQFCASHVRGEESAHYLVDRCLMRPRALLELIRGCRTRAVNLGRSRIEVDDIEVGEEQYSTKLADDVYHELHDVFPPAAELLYTLLESSAEIPEGQLAPLLARVSSSEEEQKRALELLLWHGVLGFRRSGDEASFIYSSGYNMARFIALIDKRRSNGLVYVINPAFWKGLEVKSVG